MDHLQGPQRKRTEESPEKMLRQGAAAELKEATQTFYDDHNSKLSQQQERDAKEKEGKHTSIVPRRQHSNATLERDNMLRKRKEKEVNDEDDEELEGRAGRSHSSEAVVWNAGLHLQLCCMISECVDVYARTTWAFNPLHPAALDKSNVFYILCTQPGAEEISALSFNVHICVALGYLLLGDVDRVQDLFVKIRRLAGYLFEVTDYSVALGFTVLGYVTLVRLGDVEKSSYYLRVALNLCRTLGAFNCGVYMRCLYIQYFNPAFSLSEMQRLQMEFKTIKNRYPPYSIVREIVYHHNTYGNGVRLRNLPDEALRDIEYYPLGEPCDEEEDVEKEAEDVKEQEEDIEEQEERRNGKTVSYMHSSSTSSVTWKQQVDKDEGREGIPEEQRETRRNGPEEDNFLHPVKKEKTETGGGEPENNRRSSNPQTNFWEQFGDEETRRTKINASTAEAAVKREEQDGATEKKEKAIEEQPPSNKLLQLMPLSLEKYYECTKCLNIAMNLIAAILIAEKKKDKRPSTFEPIFSILDNLEKQLSHNPLPKVEQIAMALYMAATRAICHWMLGDQEFALKWAKTFLLLTENKCFHLIITNTPQYMIWVTKIFLSTQQFENLQRLMRSMERIEHLFVSVRTLKTRLLTILSQHQRPQDQEQNAGGGAAETEEGAVYDMNVSSTSTSSFSSPPTSFSSTRNPSPPETSLRMNISSSSSFSPPEESPQQQPQQLPPQLPPSSRPNSVSQYPPHFIKNDPSIPFRSYSQPPSLSTSSSSPSLHHHRHLSDLTTESSDAPLFRSQSHYVTREVHNLDGGDAAVDANKNHNNDHLRRVYSFEGPSSAASIPAPSRTVMMQTMMRKGQRRHVNPSNTPPASSTQVIYPHSRYPTDAYSPSPTNGNSNDQLSSRTDSRSLPHSPLTPLSSSSSDLMNVRQPLPQYQHSSPYFASPSSTSVPSPAPFASDPISFKASSSQRHIIEGKEEETQRELTMTAPALLSNSHPHRFSSAGPEGPFFSPTDEASQEVMNNVVQPSSSTSSSASAPYQVRRAASPLHSANQPIPFSQLPASSSFGEQSLSGIDARSSPPHHLSLSHPSVSPSSSPQKQQQRTRMRYPLQNNSNQQAPSSYPKPQSPAPPPPPQPSAVASAFGSSVSTPPAAITSNSISPSRRRTGFRMRTTILSQQPPHSPSQQPPSPSPSPSPSAFPTSHHQPSSYTVTPQPPSFYSTPLSSQQPITSHPPLPTPQRQQLPLSPYPQHPQHPHPHRQQQDEDHRHNFVPASVVPSSIPIAPVAASPSPSHYQPPLHPSQYQQRQKARDEAEEEVDGRMLASMMEHHLQSVHAVHHPHPHPQPPSQQYSSSPATNASFNPRQQQLQQQQNDLSSSASASVHRSSFSDTNIVPTDQQPHYYFSGDASYRNQHQQHQAKQEDYHPQPHPLVLQQNQSNQNQNQSNPQEAVAHLHRFLQQQQTDNNGFSSSSSASKSYPYIQPTAAQLQQLSSVLAASSASSTQNNSHIDQTGLTAAASNNNRGGGARRQKGGGGTSSTANNNHSNTTKTNWRWKEENDAVRKKRERRKSTTTTTTPATSHAGNSSSV
ncbi:hypothetical protein QOT17_002945 [Balamuthia mandrillaris]